jgi:hypothetical protein
MMTELIGWTAATILLATIGRQVYSQWLRPQFARRVEMAFRWTNRGVYWIRRLQLVIEKLGIRRYERVDA